MIRRRATGHAGEHKSHDGAGSMRWLLTYADLITLLMVFFVMLYSISQLNQSKYIALTKSIRAAFALEANSGNAAITTSPQPALNAHNLPQAHEQSGLLQAVGSQVLDKVKAEGVQSAVTVRITRQGLRISFQARAIFFAKAHATITPEFERVLLAIAPILRPLPYQIQVQGYTDNEPLFSRKYATSWELSAARAVRVLRFLVDKGGLDPSKVSAVAFGQYHPLYSNATPQGQAMNRSVDLLITNRVAKLPAPLPVPGAGAAAGASSRTAPAATASGHSPAAASPGK